MKYLLPFITLMITFTTQAQITIADVTLPATYKLSEASLVLNGAGLREKFFMDLYVGGLYLPAKSSNADQIIAANEPMAIHIEIISKLITSKKMVDAVEEGMDKSTDGKTEDIRTEIEEMKNAFSEEINLGDVYDIVYDTKKGLLIYKNKELKKTIPGLRFKQAVFGIWLCDDPADEDLKEGMLNGK